MLGSALPIGPFAAISQDHDLLREAECTGHYSHGRLLWNREGERGPTEDKAPATGWRLLQVYPCPISQGLAWYFSQPYPL
jgi:hypothetical protein